MDRSSLGETTWRCIPVPPELCAAAEAALRGQGGAAKPGAAGRLFLLAVPANEGGSPEALAGELAKACDTQAVLAGIHALQKAQVAELKAEMQKVLAEAIRPTAAVQPPISDGEAQRVFRLFGELLGMGTDLAAPPARVFDLMVFKKMTKAETALECKCVASLITKRVALIQRHFAMPIERLRAFASDLQERQRTVKGDRYARKKHGAARDELERQDDDERPGTLEDEDGYLPEEKQDGE